MKRKPEGYRGEGHQTIGSDVLSVLNVINFPENVLGPELAATLQAAKPGSWYPIEPLLEAMERLDRKLGRAGLVQMGRNLFTTSHEARVMQVAKSAADILYGIDDMYRHANRGRDIGGWKVVELKPGRARLLKTTPHHCQMEEGILLQGLQSVGVPAMIQQLRCLRTGSTLCEYEITSTVTGEKWMGGRPPVG